LRQSLSDPEQPGEFPFCAGRAAPRLSGVA
jgi:hypothetical protein